VSVNLLTSGIYLASPSGCTLIAINRELPHTQFSNAEMRSPKFAAYADTGGCHGPERFYRYLAYQ
jgi:hypothetical protein